jgi:TatD DNase family protein
MIIDAHTHLNTNQLFWDYKKYLENFEKIWWKIVVNAWANNEYNQKWIQIAKESIKIFLELTVKTAIWRHPCDIPHNESDFLPLLDELENVYQENKDYIVAVWECGIDLHFPDNPPLEVQQYALKLQWELARKLNLPLMIHSRDAFNETMEVLKDFSDLKIYFHAWWYWKDELEECEKIFPNLRIGCTNVIEYPSAEKIREAIHDIKTAKILTETDAPFLPPQTMRGQQNEPAYVTYVYEKLCEILWIEQKRLERMVEENTKQLYQI